MDLRGQGEKRQSLDSIAIYVCALPGKNCSVWETNRLEAWSVSVLPLCVVYISSRAAGFLRTMICKKQNQLQRRMAAAGLGKAQTQLPRL